LFVNYFSHNIVYNILKANSSKNTKYI